MTRPSPSPRSRRPEGQVTRGKTAPNRLRRLDAFLAAYDAPLLRRTGGPFADACCVDLGYGAEPFTTLESAARWRRERPDLRVVGVEIDPERVERARPYADERTDFRLGGFNLPMAEGETVRLVRAMNVLRQYEESAVAPAYARLAEHVAAGGLLIEGTSEPFGAVWAVNILRRRRTADPASPWPDWQLEALVFGTHFRTPAFAQGFDPAQFQTVLPKSWIHRVVPGESIHDVFDAWKRATRETRAHAVWGVRRHFAAAARRLMEMGWRVRARRRWTGRGWLVWERPIG